MPGETRELSFNETLKAIQSVPENGGPRPIHSSTDDNGNTFFHVAVLRADTAVMSYLLAAVPPEERAESKITNAKNRQGKTPLHLAVQLDCEQVTSES